jgi:hypothetical protein
MKTTINEKVTNCYARVTPHLAILGTLATFKDGHDLKESQFEKGFSKVGLSGALLDYTSDTYGWFIWGGNAYGVIIMAILWLKKLSRQFLNIIISLITLHLHDFKLFEKLCGRFGELCLALNKYGNR